MTREVRIDDYILPYIQLNEKHRRVQTSERKTYTSKLRKAKTEAGHKATAHTYTQHRESIDKPWQTSSCVFVVNFCTDKDFTHFRLPNSEPHMGEHSSTSKTTSERR